MATLDFYIYSPHEIAVWTPVVEQLRARGADVRWVMEPPKLQRAESFINGIQSDLIDDVVVETAVRILHAQGEIPLFQGRYEEADAAVTTGWNFWIGSYKNLKFKTGYGVSPLHNSANFGGFSANFDAVFTHGELSKKYLSAYSPNEDIVVCGFPKYSPYFRGELDIASYRRRWGLDPTRPTVLYCSTWADNASLDRFAAAISDIADDYNVLYKPHHCNLRWEANRYEFLRHHPNVVVDEECRNLVPFLAVADVVVADIRSGSATEPLLMNRPVVALSSGDPKNDNVIEEVHFEKAALVCSVPDQLRTLVEQALNNDDKGSARSELASYMFSDIGADADIVMAEAMLDRIEKARNSGRIVSNVSTDPHFEHSTHPQVSVIINGNETPANVLRCLESLNHQDGSVAFDVFVTDYSPGRKNNSYIREEYYDFSVKYIESSDGIYSAMNQAAKQSSAEYLLFLEGDSFADPNLVSAHATAHQRNETAVIMGTSYADRKKPFDVLTQVIEVTPLILPTAELVDPCRIDWTMFRLLNTSIPRSLFTDIGGFVGSGDSVIAHATDLALRVETANADLLFHPALKVGRMREADVDIIRNETTSAYVEIVDVIRRNPQILDHIALSLLKNESVENLEAAENIARGQGSDSMITLRALSQAHTQRLNNVGLEPLAGQTFVAMLGSLREVWIRLGIAAGLRKANVTTLDELAPKAPEELLPWPLATKAENLYVAWPDYNSEEDLAELMKFAIEISDSSSCLVVRCDPVKDGNTDFAIERIEKAYNKHIPIDKNVEVLMVADSMQEHDVRRLGVATNGTIVLPSTTHPERKAFVELLETPLITSPEQLRRPSVRS